MLVDEARECRLDIAFAASMQDQRLNAECARCTLHVSNLGFRSWIPRVDEEADNFGAGVQVAQPIQPLCPKGVSNKSYSCDIFPGTVESGNDTEIDRIGADRENDRNGCGCSFGSHCRGRRESNDRGDGVRYEIAGQCRQAVEARIRGPIFDCKIAPLDIASVFEAPPNALICRSSS